MKHKPNNHHWLYEQRFSGRRCLACPEYQIRDSRKWVPISHEKWREILDTVNERERE